LQQFPLDISMGSLSVRVINQNNLECAQWQKKVMQSQTFLNKYIWRRVQNSK